MKNTFTILLLFAVALCFGQPDLTPITVEVRDNAKLQWNGSVVKMKVKVLAWAFVRDGQKEFYFNGYLEMYANNAGAYGSKITDLILADETLSNEEKIDLLDRYRDREVQYTTTGKFTDANGNLVAGDAVGAIPELQYWQSFKMNNAALGMTSASTQGALDGVYKIIIAIVNRMNTRKNF